MSSSLLTELPEGARSRLDQPTLALLTTRWRRADARLRTSFARLYGQHSDGPAAWSRLLDVICRQAQSRDPLLREVDASRPHDWYLSSKAIGYSCYVDRF